MNSPISEKTIRSRIRSELPADTFDRQPARALWFVPLLATVVVGTWAVLAFELPWDASLAIAVVLSQAYAAMGFLAHEALHGSMVRSRRLQDVLGTLGFGPFLISPQLWRVWHNQVHHGHTNQGNSDPDSFGTLARYQKAPSTRFVALLGPGSGRWYSYLFLGYWFTFHGQVVLWVQARYMKLFRGFDRRRAIAESAVFATLWLALAWVAGPWNSLFVMVVPMVLANATVMSYIATNHFMRPQTETNNPVENAMSVDTPAFIDGIHFNFSHHVEHHLFPAMSAGRAPRIRRWLRREMPDRYVSPPHWKAIAELYRTPRVYLDANTLCDPTRPERQVSIAHVTEALTGHPVPVGHA